jgi:2-succinyl-5-enolpyruvyl-6-hydroxy-3-cyclohexene-1-carboxylate synthase
VDHIKALTRWVGTLVHELVLGGVSQFVVCPGSRSTPLALAVARHPAARVWVHMDERSAAFFALGMARQRGEPVALVCTSGTAAANFLPAVAEADLSRVPLVLLTADRPHELRDNGAPQTIDQVRIFGTTTRWASDLPTPGDTPDLLAYARAVAARAIAAARGAPAGPVQLNLPFREPLVPDRALLAEIFAAPAVGPAVRAVGGPRVLPDAELAALAARLAGARRGLILCGPGCESGLAPAVAALAARLGFPVLADPLSGVRCGPHERALVLSAYDAFLRDERFAAGYAPELVLRFGAMPTAKPVLQYLQRHRDAHTVVVDPGAGWREPTSLAAEHLGCDGPWLCAALLERLGPAGAEPLPSHFWRTTWLAAERAARAAIAGVLDAREAISEPGVFAALAAALPDGATLFVGNSMPVRDCDTFFPSSERAVAIVGNRGANGIDGLVSSALGAAAGGAGPLVIAIGDLSLYHDSNGLIAARLHGLDATLVLINNDGGGIFSFLPQASEQDLFEPLFGTPHGLDFRGLAELYGARYTLVESWPAFRAALDLGGPGRGLHIVEVRTERSRNVADHREIWPRVGAALEQTGVV